MLLFVYKGLNNLASLSVPDRPALSVHSVSYPKIQWPLPSYCP